MIAVVVVLALALAVSPAVTVSVLTRYLEQRDAREMDERQVLLQRIQAPEQAVVEHQQARVLPDLPAVDPFDDEDHWKAIQQAEEVMDRFQREVIG